MNITKKDLENNKAVITVEVEKTDYTEKVDKKLREYRKKANIPGFRPGMVPIGLLRKMYGKAVTVEEINNVVSEALYGYLRENEINILGEPLPNSEQKEPDFDNNENFEFLFDVAIAPQMDIDFSEKDKVTYYTITASEEMIDNQVESYAQRYGEYKQAETVEPKDMVKGTLVELSDGKEKEEGIKVNNAVLTPDYMKDDAQKALFEGKQVGDKIIFNPKKAYDNDAEISSMLQIDKEKAKEMDADVEITIEEITRYAKSEINQALFDKVFGEGTVSSEDEFRNKVKESIQKNLHEDSNYKFALDVRELALEKNKELKFPDELIKRWLTKSNQEATEEQINNEYPTILKDLMWQLTKDYYAKANDTKVETTDVEKYAQKVATSQFAQYGMVGMNDEFVANYAKSLMEKEENVRNFAERALEEKVINSIKEKVTLEDTEITIDDFNKLFETKEETPENTTDKKETENIES